MVSHWRLNDSKLPQVSWTLRSILDVFNNAVVWMVSTRPPTSKSSRLFINPSVTVLKTPIANGIFVTFMFHSFFQFSSQVEVLMSLFKILIFESFFISTTAGILSQDFQRQQISSCFLDHSQCSGCSKKKTALVLTVSTRPFNNHFVTVPKAPITIDIIVTFMFHRFFNFLARSRYISFISFSFNFILWAAGTAKATIVQVPYFLLIIIRSGFLTEIKLYISRSKCHRSLSQDICWVLHIPLFVCSN